MFVIIIIGVLLIILKGIGDNNRPKCQKKSSNYAILIPARNESKVINDLLNSIDNQTMKVKDVYVIVESKSDKIVENHNMNIIYRKDLTKQRKGYAIDDVIKEIDLKYDAYFIFDADNILDRDYILNMKDSIDKGYDIGCGYRNSKNGNDSIISAASSLTFSAINLLNKMKAKQNKTITVSGTGFYMSGELVNKLKSYPFNSLTEDYELTLYATISRLTTTYNDKAIFYDEQPINFKQSMIQRTRWVKGYFEARKKQIKKFDIRNSSLLSAYIGIKPYILIIIALIFYLLKNIIVFEFTLLLKGIVLIYLILTILTYLIINNDKKLNLSNKMKVKSIFYNPLFLVTYINCALKALFKKEVKWDVIDHGGSK